MQNGELELIWLAAEVIENKGFVVVVVGDDICEALRRIRAGVSPEDIFARRRGDGLRVRHTGEGVFGP